ncbi:hypothetical protein IQ244_13960 [Nostoc sp. LEGE 06077]|uniref:hypothetical protein n=1 Tax=Nostoc sp. LEGE 06077 TaxID=915325 RepID=UPI00187EE562|nr:hypothetical protein [Nostoc sp. LEGE 06077]MBE9207606.1 hypothetical protein [Nostoc sp. LEGE 06077]
MAESVCYIEFLGKDSPAIVNIRNFVNCGYFNFSNLKENNPSLYQKIFMQEFFGIEPTASRISPHLSKPGTILQENAIAAVRAVRRELGWEK